MQQRGHSLAVDKDCDGKNTIIQAMKFKINPPTLFSLANMMMQQWDMFLT